VVEVRVDAEAVADLKVDQSRAFGQRDIQEEQVFIGRTKESGEGLIFNEHMSANGRIIYIMLKVSLSEMFG
jgi:hypothetical protein